MMVSKRRHKYGAQPTVVDNIRFASKAESRRYLELKLLEKAGEIYDLELQPKFPLMMPALLASTVTDPWIKVGVFVGDFKYRRRPKGALVVEDVKGVRTAIYRLKKRMVEAQYGITITEVP